MRNGGGAGNLCTVHTVSILARNGVIGACGKYTGRRGVLVLLIIGGSVDGCELVWTDRVPAVHCMYILPLSGWCVCVCGFEIPPSSNMVESGFQVCRM